MGAIMVNVRKARRIEPEPEFLAISDRAPDALIKRMEALASEAASPLAGFPIGKMKLRGEFGKDAQARFEACVWYHALYHRYQKIMGSKTIAPQSMEVGMKSEPPDPDSERGRKMTKRETREVRDYLSARLAGLACGVENWGYFLAVVIDEHEPDWRLKNGVVLVSDALRRHRALISRHRQGRR